jgi:hypothetical protein
MGQESYFSLGRVLASLGTLGIVRPSRQGPPEPPSIRVNERWPQLGFFDAEHFSPRSWQPVVLNPAFTRQTRRDRYWGAKRVVQFNRDEIRGAIAAGDYPPDVAEHLLDVLWKRREKIARAWFSEVAALDGFRLEGNRLCFEDLWLQAGLGGGTATAYEAREHDRVLPLDLSHCVQLAPRLGYRVIELRVRRPGERHFGPAVQVHLIEHRSRTNIVGIER